jgi:hypothetical protein
VFLQQLAQKLLLAQLLQIKLVSAWKRKLAELLWEWKILLAKTNSLILARLLVSAMSISVVTVRLAKKRNALA